jgi:hypothetical protein
MKELLKTALDDAKEKLEKQIPKTKNQVKEICIDEVNPSNLASFMEENRVPSDAVFSSNECSDETFLYWTVKVPTTESDKEQYRRNRFDSIAWTYVYGSLTHNGYKRTGCWSSEFKKFDDTTVYEMYMNKDFDRIEKYYSLRFKKIDSE